jgi:hypothetical protein
MKDWTSQKEDSSRGDQSCAVSAQHSWPSGDLAALPNLYLYLYLWQSRGATVKDVMATNVPRLRFLLVFLLVRGFGIIQMASPDFQLSAQPSEIETGERAVRAVEIAQGTIQNRARTHMVAFGLVMKSDRQLNHALDMLTEMPA